ncbi:MAG: cytochrome c biogenesis protein CcsA [Acidimicrobiales bacterium]
MRVPEVAAPAHTGSRTTRGLGAVVAAGLAAVVILALFVTPPDREQSDAVRLLYLHVPAVSVSYVAFAVTTLGSVLWLWKKSRWWDLVAASSAEIGLVLTCVTLVSGALWGRPIWGTYWTWDARLTSTALLFLLVVGYLAVRQVPAEAPARNTRAAIVALLIAADLPIVHFAVDWWQGLHQDATIGTTDVQIDGLMLFTLMLGMTVMLGLYVWLLIHRFRVAWLEERAADRGLEHALAERRAEAGVGV